MKKHFILISLTLVLFTNGQRLKIIQPTLSNPAEYSKKEQLEWEKSFDIYSKLNSGELDYEELTSSEMKMIDSLEMGYGPMTEGVGCSWYCGGGPYKVTASSYLEDQGSVNYQPDNAHDFDLLTAWVPDVNKGHVGKKLNFHFKPFAPRINEIIIWNGYIKNTDLWEANARVAKLKMSVNGVPVSLFHLEDNSCAQSFKIEAVQSTDSLKDLVLTLEVIEVYKGTKYLDVAISEINFNGLDVHCFGAGTKILMANQTVKNIELIEIGEEVSSYNPELNEINVSIVTKVIEISHHNLMVIKLEDREVTVTDDHPFLTEQLKWASLNPNRSNTNYNHKSKVELLKVGSKIFVPEENRFIKVIEVKKLHGDYTTYTLELEGEQNFIANGLLAKTELLK